MRSKCNLVKPEPLVAREPATGPGSAVCFCRVMARRELRREACPSLYPVPLEASDAAGMIPIEDAADLAMLQDALLALRARGLRFAVRVVSQ